MDPEKVCGIWGLLGGRHYIKGYYGDSSRIEWREGSMFPSGKIPGVQAHGERGQSF